MFALYGLEPRGLQVQATEDKGASPAAEEWLACMTTKFMLH